MRQVTALASAMLFMCFQSGIVLANEYSVPREHWEFMDGYKYDYPGCSVGWSIRTGSFMVNGDKCDHISAEKMRADALKSIEYVKKHSNAHSFFSYYEASELKADAYMQEQAVADAQKIWFSGCSDFKNGMNEGDFRKWLRLSDNTDGYPKLKKMAFTNLYLDGWETARKLKGVLNCTEIARYRASDYISGVDIRSNP